MNGMKTIVRVELLRFIPGFSAESDPEALYSRDNARFWAAHSSGRTVRRVSISAVSSAGWCPLRDHLDDRWGQERQPNEPSDIAHADAFLRRNRGERGSPAPRPAGQTTGRARPTALSRARSTLGRGV